ncbi:MAG: hypothetical protein ACFBQW_04790 [Sphingomonadaceae bacterium]
MSDSDKLAEAQARRQRAKSKLLETAERLQRRLKPAAIAGRTWQGVRGKGEALADSAVDTVKERPAMFGAAAAAAALFLARRPIGALIGKMRDGKTEDQDLVAAGIDAEREEFPLTAPEAPARKKKKKRKRKRIEEGLEA